jgi:hypothetical protein
MSRTTSSIPLYNPLMTSFKLITTLAGQRLELPIQGSMSVDAVKVLIDLKVWGYATVPTTLLLLNPFGAPVVIHEVALDIYYNKTLVGYAKTNTGIIICYPLPHIRNHTFSYQHISKHSQHSIAAALI